MRVLWFATCDMRTRYKVTVSRLKPRKMASSVLLCLTVMSVVQLTVGFEYSDLEAMNATCPSRDSCKSEKGPRMSDQEDWKRRNCFCDVLCAEYGDCCLDAKVYKAEEQKENRDNFECVHLKQFGEHYMQGRCMAGWDDLEIALLCSSGSPDSHSDRRDPLADLPVTSLDTAITYNNFYCAVCNNDSTSLEIWKPRLECPTLTSYNARFRNLTMEYISSKLVYNDVNWGIYLNDNGVDVFHTCTVDPVMPETVVHMVRKCKKMTMTCLEEWRDTEEEALCLSYTAVVYNFDKPYRNIHCAKCNNVPSEITQCYNGAFTRFYFRDDFNPSSFSLLFDFMDNSGSNIVGSSSTCGVGEVFDPFFKKCRNVVCGKANQQYRFGRCIDLHANPASSTEVAPSSSSIQSVESSTASTSSTTESSAEFSTDIMEGENEGRVIERLTEDVTEFEEETEPTSSEPSTSSNKNLEATQTASVSSEISVTSSDTTTEQAQTLTCERFMLPAEEYTMGENGTVVVEKYQRTYQAHEYERREGGILVCIIQPEADKFSRLMGWMSLAGLGLSCVCLLLHLGAFTLVPELRNLSGKNLASLCLVLLAAYTTFILSVFGEPGKRECFILAAAMYYFFLSSFCWMSVMAFDIWRTLRMATSELRVSSGGQWRKFFAYSVYGWLLPGAALVALVVLDIVRPEGMPAQFFPTLGERWCWFGQRKALLVFFAAPLATIMLINIILFIFSARIIAETTQSTAKMSSCSPHQNQFKLYMRLALLMGLTWISGIVAGYLQVEPIWYIFVLLNTLQGVFIFLAFTCTRKVWRVIGGGCWRRVVLARRGVSWVGRSPSSSRQGLESRDSNDSQLSHASHSSVTHLTSNSRTSVDAF